jgi:hypothetical protein
MSDWTDATSPNATDDPLLRRARRRVAMKTGFLIHALVFTLVNLGLFMLNEAIGGRHWSHFPLAGWGLGLAIHGIVIVINLAGDGWRERMVSAELARLRSQG